MLCSTDRCGQSLKRLGRRGCSGAGVGGQEGRFSRDPLPVRFAEGHCDQFRHGLSTMTSSIQHYFPPPTTASPILQIVLKNLSGRRKLNKNLKLRFFFLMHGWFTSILGKRVRFLNDPIKLQACTVQYEEPKRLRCGRQAIYDNWRCVAYPIPLTVSHETQFLHST